MIPSASCSGVELVVEESGVALQAVCIPGRRPTGIRPGPRRHGGWRRDAASLQADHGQWRVHVHRRRHSCVPVYDDVCSQPGHLPDDDRGKDVFARESAVSGHTRIVARREGDQWHHHPISPGTPTHVGLGAPVDDDRAEPPSREREGGSTRNLDLIERAQSPFAPVKGGLRRRTQAASDGVHPRVTRMGSSGEIAGRRSAEGGRTSSLPARARVTHRPDPGGCTSPCTRFCPRHLRAMRPPSVRRGRSAGAE